ncbi:hypothetical protein JWH16_04325 [Xanthomonas campestris pv. campestris]|uniref:hypothetical protein n=1 Tax=Xanthomonas campestris TaxID=339 RepID=UPI001E37FC4A|nr:hypothetical protein [Xanthomonas campestris]MCD0253081.1 hypothetical protein [Xanthomonas campestris pv. campestris]
MHEQANTQNTQQATPIGGGFSDDLRAQLIFEALRRSGAKVTRQHADEAIAELRAFNAI